MLLLRVVIYTKKGITRFGVDKKYSCSNRHYHQLGKDTLCVWGNYVINIFFISLDLMTLEKRNMFIYYALTI